MRRFTADMPEQIQERVHTAFATSHSEVAGVAALAAEAGVKRLVLTHLLPQETDEELVAACAPHFDGEVIVASDGLQLEVPG